MTAGPPETGEATGTVKTELPGLGNLPDGAVVTDADGTPCVDVPAGGWAAAVRHARDGWGCAYFDWLSAVDATDGDPPGFDVVLHVVRLPTPTTPPARVLLRTRVPSSEPVLPSVTDLYPGAAWHERETHEMFGIAFTGFDDHSGLGLRPLLLPDGFVGTPLRKEFQLAARAAKPWPGAKEPGESHEQAASPSRRKLLPPGVPDAAAWGPRRPTPPPVPPPASAEPEAPPRDGADASEGEEGDGGA